MQEDKCSACGTKDNLPPRPTSIYHRKDGTIHIQYICTDCNTKRARRYRAKPYGAARMREAVKRSVKKYQYKQNARNRVYAAIKSGRLQKPEACENCGDRSKPPHAHHEDYNKPLEVMWLCRRCHTNIHKVVLYTV